MFPNLIAQSLLDTEFLQDFPSDDKLLLSGSLTTPRYENRAEVDVINAVRKIGPQLLCRLNAEHRFAYAWRSCEGQQSLVLNEHKAADLLKFSFSAERLRQLRNPVVSRSLTAVVQYVGKF